jgi:hypothetical protein
MKHKNLKKKTPSAFLFGKTSSPVRRTIKLLHSYKMSAVNSTQDNAVGPWVKEKRLKPYLANDRPCVSESAVMPTGVDVLKISKITRGKVDQVSRPDGEYKIEENRFLGSHNLLETCQGRVTNNEGKHTRSRETKVQFLQKREEPHEETGGGRETAAKQQWSFGGVGEAPRGNKKRKAWMGGNNWLARNKIKS